METIMKHSARIFLEYADRYNEEISNAMNSGCNEFDKKCYNTAKELEATMLKYYNELHDENIKPGLNYEIAEYILSGEAK